MPGAPALGEIRKAFGNGIITKDGTLDRKAMRGIVFADDGKRLQLEAILHPRIRDLTEQQVSVVNDPYLIVVVPLLVESPMKSAMDRILVVDCSEETQIERLIARDVETEEQARRIMATQSSREDRLAIAHDVIANNGNLDDLHKQVLALHHSYLELAEADDSSFA